MRLTIVTETGVYGDGLAAVLRVFVCRKIIFDIHVVRSLRVCRNAAAEWQTWRIYDPVAITTRSARASRPHKGHQFDRI